MPYLRVVQGGRPGELHDLTDERIVLGRHPSCEVVLDNAAISRQHARLIRQGQKFILEDLGSRNGTFVNGKAVSGSSPISNRDRIRICDIVLEYLDDLPVIDATVAEGLRYHDLQRLEPGGLATIEHESDFQDLESSSSIITSLNASTIGNRFDVRPEVKLRAIVEMTSQFSGAVDVKEVMNKTLECLFRIFPQSQMGLLLLRNPKSDQLEVRAARSRHGEESTNQKTSSTIIRRALETDAAILSEDMGDDTRFRDSESASQLEIRSLMCSPLSGGEGGSFGAIQLTSKDLKNPFNQDDLDLFASVAAQAALAIENAHLNAEVISRREMERDLEVATQIQLGFLPNRKPSFLGFEFSHFYQAAQQVGGDYFDYVRLPDGRLAIVVGDVSGKGVPAALLMARLCSAVRYHLVAQKDVGQAMTELNRELLSNSLGFRFITLVMVILEPGKKSFVIANAGHLPPLMFTKDSSQYVEGSFSGLPLGVGGECDYEAKTIDISPGTSLLLYTDGITETENDEGDLFGRERLLKSRPKGNFSTEDLVNQTLQQTIEFGGDQPQRDDRCVVAIKYVG